MALVLSSHVSPLDKFNMYWAEGGRGNLDAGVFLRKGSVRSPPSPGLNPNCGGGHGETNKQKKMFEGFENRANLCLTF